MLPTHLHQMLHSAAERTPEAEALTSRDRTLSYEQLLGEAAGFAVQLAELGLRRGERVAIYLEKRIETVAAVYGASAVGGVFVPVNPLLLPRQVGHVLADCGVRVLVTSPQRMEQLREVLADSQTVEHVVLVGADELPETPPSPRNALHRWAGTGEIASWTSGGVDIDAAGIFYTSGSTGRPKGVVLSHRNLIAGAVSVSGYLGNRADDRILAALPLSFDAGFSQLTTACAVGAHVVLIDYLLPRDLVRACERHRITGITGVPPLWIHLADVEWPETATAAVRYFANTGGRMPRVTLDRLRAIFPNASPFLMYGLTEAFRSTYLDPAQVDRRPDSIGKAIPNAEIVVVSGDGRICGPGEEGELVHRGALVSLGYWGDPERTAERFKPAPGRDPAIPTTELAVWSGDMVRIDDEGFLYFVGRRDEMIKTSGYRVSPTEIEEVAYDSGLVGAAAAVGVDDSRIGQRIVLVVSPLDGQELDRAALAAKLRQQLPRFMVPQRIEVRAQLPRSPNGKFDRVLLRTELSEA